MFQPFIWVTLYSIATHYLFADGKHLFIILNREDSKTSLIEELKKATDQPKDKQNPH